MRPLQQKDLTLLLKWRNHASIRKSMLSQHIISPSEHIDWFSSNSLDPNFQPMIYEENNCAMGYVSFTILAEGGSAEWGFYSAPDAPKGTGTRMGECALSYAFKDLKLKKIYGQALHTNAISQNFHIKLGFHQEGIAQKQSAHDSRYHDIICYSLLQKDWFNNDKS